MRQHDNLQAPGSYDIPNMGSDIPVVSKLAKQTEKDKMANMDGQQQLDYQKQKKRDVLDKVVKDDEMNLETHFVENPYIKMRERANQGSKNLLDEKKLTGDDEQMVDQDIYVEQENGKFVIQDFEGM